MEVDEELIKIDVQIRTVKPVPAIGTDHFAIHFVHFEPTAVANENLLLT